MDRKKGLVIIFSLIFLLGVVDAAWILSYNKTITGNVAGGKFFTISREFSNEIDIDTTDGSDSDSTTMNISDLKSDKNVNVDVNAVKTNLDSSDCPDYKDDCRIIITHIYDGIKDVLINSTSSNPTSKNFILLKDIDNMIEYKISCVENSCEQSIVSNVTIEAV